MSTRESVGFHATAEGKLRGVGDVFDFCATLEEKCKEVCAGCRSSGISVPGERTMDLDTSDVAWVKLRCRNDGESPSPIWCEDHCAIVITQIQFR
jgi:hypothetical protein